MSNVYYDPEECGLEIVGQTPTPEDDGFWNDFLQFRQSDWYLLPAFLLAGVVAGMLIYGLVGLILEALR